MQNGVLKALSFLFEYIGEMGKDYIYAVSPLLEDALMDRDLVSRSTRLSDQYCPTLKLCGSSSHLQLLALLALYQGAKASKSGHMQH